jgi:hypothetical protein
MARVTPFTIQSPKEAFVPLIAPMIAILIGVVQGGVAVAAGGGVAVAKSTGTAGAVVATTGACVGVAGVAQEAKINPRTSKRYNPVRFILVLLFL